MQHQEFEPSEELRDLIKCFWYNKRDFGEIESNFEVQPDGSAEIIFHFGSGCNISYNGNLQPLSSVFVMGLLNQPILLSTKNRFEVIGIRCFPWTVFGLLGLPPSKGNVHITEHPIARLHSTLNKCIEAGRIDEAIAELKKYFLNAWSSVTNDITLVKAGVAMRAASGAIRVGKVAEAAHSTVRTLERKFKQSSGFTVKDVSGLMRFERVRNKLWLNPTSNITDLAFELGYTDQSHLSREFKRYSGITPSAFARKAKVSNDFVAFIQV